MKKYIYTKALSIVPLLFLSFMLFGQTNVSGIITDDTGESLIGANVIVQGTSIGATTDINGNFSFDTDTPTPFTLEVTYTGFNTATMVVNDNISNLSISLSEGVLIGEDVIISASRRREKVQEAPASVSVLNTRALSVTPDTDPTRTLGNLSGVTIQQQSASRVNIEMRGQNGLFSTFVFPIMDYRNLVGAGTGTFVSSQEGISSIDLDRVEVVRGPASALYGAGVTSGVVHFITKNPIDHPGTTVELTGGELSTLGVNLRHATKVSDKFGFKINAVHRQGDEFTLDPNDPDDAIQIARFVPSLSNPDVSKGYIDISQPSTVLIQNIDEDGDGNPMAPDYRNTSINATLQFSPTDNVSAFLSGGWSENKEVFYNAQGEGLNNAQQKWVQGRVQIGGLFAQMFYVDNDGGSVDRPTWLYQTGQLGILARKSLEAQVQYNFEIPSLNADITFGGDYRGNENTSGNLVFGRYDGSAYDILGGYAQGKFGVSDKFDIVAALRYDSYNFLDDGFIAPRLGLVYKANNNHNFRLTYNRAGAPHLLVHLVFL